MEWSGQSTDGFSASFLKWAEKAGVSGSLTDDEEQPGDTGNQTTRTPTGDGGDEE